tara:strand:+ start:2119 stop:2967 length:849 start_codon:yes stop_codon:yes gene_type:complete
MSYKKIKSYAKINLSLGVLGRLKSGYHKVESLVSFINLHDEIKIRKIFTKNHKIKFFGKFSKGIKKNNTINTLLKILDEKNLLYNQKYSIKIKKNIPQKAGLGGGSMNAATILRFFITNKILTLSKKNIIKLCQQVGFDVQLGIDNNNKALYSNGNLGKLSKKIRLFVLVIKPNFGCSTKKIYDSLKYYSPKKLKEGKRNYYSLKNVLKLQNDLEKVVLKKYPQLNQVKLFMQSLPKIQLIRMTGSGSSILGYFLTKNASKNAAKLFKKKYKNYWCITSKTI